MPISLTLRATDEFGGGQLKLDFEHSLVSLSKWEALHKKAFFGKEPRTPEEGLSYFEQMLLTPNLPPDIVRRLGLDEYQALHDYINSSETATVFGIDPNQKPNNTVITTEQVYDWMIEFGIPWEAQTWHFSRLMVLVRIRSIKQTKQKPMSKKAQQEQYARLNAERRAKLGTAG